MFIIIIIIIITVLLFEPKASDLKSRRAGLTRVSFGPRDPERCCDQAALFYMCSAAVHVHVWSCGVLSQMSTLNDADLDE